MAHLLALRFAVALLAQDYFAFFKLKVIIFKGVVLILILRARRCSLMSEGGPRGIIIQSLCN